MRMRVNKYARFAAHVFSYVALTNLLVHSYLVYQVPLWGYLGYSEDYSLMRHILASICSVLLALVAPMRIAGLTSFTLFLVASTTLVAMLAMYAARGYSLFYLISIIIFFLIVRLLAERLRFRIPPRKSSSIPILAVSGLAFGISVAWVAARGGLSNLNFNLLKIYSVREVAMDRYFTGPFAYILNWAEKIFGPTLLAFSIVRKSTLIMAIAIFGQVFFYASIGQKTPIALIVFVFAAIGLIKFRPSAWCLNLILIFLIIISEVLLNFGYLWIYAIYTWRIFFSAASNNIAFFEFFSENDFTYFSTTFLRGVIDYPYSSDIFNLISLFKLGRSDITPNTGVFGTGYQHMGYLGLLLYAVLSGLILALLESLAKATPNWVPLAVAGPPMYIMFTSADMPVALLTNGGLIAMLVLFLWPAERPSLLPNLPIEPTKGSSDSGSLVRSRRYRRL